MKNFLRKSWLKEFAMQNLLMRAMLIAFAFFVFAGNVKGQVNTEKFETESHGSSKFTDNGVVFDIISKVDTYDIMGAYPNTGWDGFNPDNRYIDNSGSGNQSVGTSFSIKTTSNLFKVNQFWVFVAGTNLTQGVAGTLTITGKLSGITKFTQTKTTGFTASTSTFNGFTLINLTNLNGQNYSNIVIDELQLTAGGSFVYLALDAFSWVKDSGQVLPVTLTSFNASLSANGILKANWKTASEKNNSHFILQGSADGKTWKDLARKSTAADAKAGASYEVETNIAAVSLAGFGLLGLLLLPFTNRRYRTLALLAVVAITVTACAKDEEMSGLNLSAEKSINSHNIYVRLAQVDHDGTTTYSNIVVLKALKSL